MQRAGNEATCSFKVTLDFPWKSRVVSRRTLHQPLPRQHNLGTLIDTDLSMNLETRNLYKWEVKAPYDRQFYLTPQLPGELRSFDVRMFFNKLSESLLWTYSDIAVRVIFKNLRDINETPLELDDHWFQGQWDASALQSNAIQLFGSGYSPLLAVGVYFEGITIKLLVPVTEETIQPVTDIDTTLEFADIGFKTTKGDAEDTLIDIVHLDLTPPRLVCPSSLVYTLGQEQKRYVPQALDIAPKNMSDNFGYVELTQSSPTSFTAGVHEVTLIAMDAANNTANCTFTVEVLSLVASIGGSGAASKGNASAVGAGTSAGMLVLCALAFFIYWNHS